jgi:hypothetical protein
MENKYPVIEALPEDLRKLCAEGAKVYIVPDRALGTVANIDSETKSININIGTKKLPMTTRYTLDQYAQLLGQDRIVAKSRLTDTEQGGFRVKPRTVSPTAAIEEELESAKGLLAKIAQPAKTSPIDNKSEIGYVDFKGNKFSKEPKEGYIKINYSIEKQKVQLELNSEQIEKLKALGILEA